MRRHIWLGLSATAMLGWVGSADAQVVGYGAMQTYGYYGGVGPYGWGPYSYGMGPYGTPPGLPSMSVYTEDQVRLAQQMEQSARYRMQSAQAANASAAANAMRQQALASALRTRRRTIGPAVPKFDVRNRAVVGDQPPPAADDRELSARLAAVIDPTGQVLWPIPLDDLLTQASRGSRKTAEDAVADVYESYVTNGQATLGQVIEARQALRVFGQPLLDRLDLTGDGVRLDRLKGHLNAIDAALVDMANPDPQDRK
jgi:hypothetical protein